MTVRSFCHETETQDPIASEKYVFIRQLHNTATEKEQISGSEESPAQAGIVLRSVLTLQEIKDSKQAKT